jgi:hypothetical protein
MQALFSSDDFAKHGAKIPGGQFYLCGRTANATAASTQTNAAT